MKPLLFLILLSAPAFAHEVDGLPPHDAVHWVPVVLGLVVIALAARLAWAKARR